MKKFVERFIIIFLIFIPLGAVAIFIFGENILDLDALILGLLTYIGTVFLGIVIFKQNERLNNINEKFQEKLTRLQIRHIDFTDIKNSVVEAMTAFNLDWLAHLTEYSNDNLISDHNIIEKIVSLEANLHSTRSTLLINTDFNNDLEKDPCFSCEKSGLYYKDYVKATVNFRNSFNENFSIFLKITSDNRIFLAMMRDIKNITKRIKIAEDEIQRISMPPTYPQYSELKNLIEKLLIERSKLESEAKLLKDSTIKSFSKDFVDEVLNLIYKSRLYLSALKESLANPYYKNECKNCLKRKNYLATLGELINKDFVSKDQNKET
ncbi:MAG: hypothetical protein FWE36_08120 [Erysipelotrichales bacterium]|nr:hypothetical protein [Erysipelotrichales bacterium]